jgi:hypothetical protein
MRAPVWLAPDASPALALRRPLGAIARPARGRSVAHQVMLAAVPPTAIEAGSHRLVHELAWEVGPTRCAPVVVVVHLGRDAVTAALFTAPLSQVPAAGLNHALAMYDAAVASMGAAVLLVAACPVLWPQARPRTWPPVGLS